MNSQKIQHLASSAYEADTTVVNKKIGKAQAKTILKRATTPLKPQFNKKGSATKVRTPDEIKLLREVKPSPESPQPKESPEMQLAREQNAQRTKQLMSDRETKIKQRLEKKHQKLLKAVLPEKKVQSEQTIISSAPIVKTLPPIKEENFAKEFDPNRKRFYRTDKWIKSKAPTSAQVLSTLNKVDSDFAEEKTRRTAIKQTSRDFYAKRAEKNGVKTLTNARFLPDIKGEVRVRLYNKHHKCKCHGLRFNGYKVEGNIITFTCDRKMRPTASSIPIEARCINCGTTNLVQETRLKCECVVHHCKQCGFDIYNRNGEDSIICHCPQEIIGTFISPTTKKWTNNKQARAEFFNEMRALQGIKLKKVPKANILSIQEWPELIPAHGGGVSMLKSVSTSLGTTATKILESIRDTIKATVEKVKDFFSKVVVTKIKDLLGKKIFAFFATLLEFLKDCFDSIVDWICENPLMTPSVIQTLMIVLTEKPSFWNISSAIGVLLTLIGQPLSEMFSKALEAVDPKHIVTGFFSFETVNRLITFIFQEKNEKDFMTNVKYTVPDRIEIVEAHGSFSSMSANALLKLKGIFEDLFDHKFSTKIFTDCLRNFNLAFSATKNVTQIFTCFLDYMPDFIKALFRSGDTRKFIGHQIRKKGSPFYLYTKAALAVGIAKEMGADDRKLGEVKEAYNLAHRNLLNFIRDQDLTYDNHIVDFLKKMEIGVRLPGTAGKDIVEPFIIRISGDAGVGKSNLPYPFLSAVSAAYGEKETVDSIKKKTYIRNPMVEHWDGCTPDMIYGIYDDYGQDREETDLREMILLDSKATFRPPYSNIEPSEENLVGIKGNVVNWRAAVLCSNMTQIFPKTLNSNQAINRRKHIMFHCSFLPGHTTPELDYSHLRIERLHCSGNPDEDYKPMWVGSGKVGIFRAQKEIREAAEKHKKTNVDLETVAGDLMYDEARAVHEEHLAPSIKPLPPAPQTINVKLVGGDINISGKSTKSYRDAATEAVPPHGVEDYVQMIDEKLNGYYGNLAGDILSSIISGTVQTIAIFHIVHFLKIFVNNFKFEMKGLTIIAAGGLSAAIFLSVRAMRAQVIPADSGENRDPKAAVKIKAQEGIDQETSKPISSLYANNTCTLKLAEGNRRWMNGLFVKSNIVLVNKHFFYNFEEGGKWIPDGTVINIWTQRAKEPFMIKFDHKRMVQVGDDAKDLVIYQLPPIVPAMTTISHLFWDGTNAMTNRSVGCIQADFGGFVHWKGRVLRDQIATSTEFKINGRLEEIVQHGTFVTNIPSENGKCGSVFYAEDNLLQNKILGMNVGGLPGESHCIIVTREQLEKAFNQLSESVFERLAPQSIHSGWREPTTEDIQRADLEGVLSIHAVSHRKMVPAIKSRIKPSPLHEKIAPVTTRPAKMYLKGKMREGILKYSEPSLDFPQEILDEAMSSIKEELDGIPTVRLNRTLTTDEAINGIPDMPFIDSLDMTTSAGFPFSYTGETGPKRRLFEEVNGRLRPNAELASHIEVIEERLKNKILPDYPYIDTLKDERRELLDWEEGKVRLFSMNNVALSIVMRKLLLPRIASAYQMRGKSFLAIGTNKASLEWDSLMRRMLEVDNLFFDADYKKFDSRASLAARLTANKFFIENWMSEEERTMIETVLRYDSQALHQYYEFIVALASGTSSGSILTALINSLINELYVRSCWLIAMEKYPAMRCLSNYRRFVRTTNYGDDLLLTILRALHGQFNDKIIAEILSRYDITMTPGNKRGEWGAKTLDEVSFLKHGTRLWLGQYVPLAKNYKEQINWIRTGAKAPDAETACADNCNSALRAAFYYGFETFEELRNQILLHRPNYNLIRFQPLFDQFKQYGTICDSEGTFTFAKKEMSVTSIINHFENMTPKAISNDEIMDNDHKMNSQQQNSHPSAGAFAEKITAHGILDGIIDSGANAVKGLVNDLVPDNVVSDMFGLLDKPQVGLHPEPLVYKEQNYMGSTRNMDYVDVLTADPKAQQFNDQDIFGTTVDEMSITELFKKPVLVATVPWSGTDPVGKVLFSDKVGPMSKFPIAFGYTSQSAVPIFDMITSRFAYWAGSWRYIYRVVGTQFHEGKLNTNFYPTYAPTTTAAFDADTSVSQYTETHFVRNGQNIIPVECPFMGDTPVRKVWCGQTLSDTYAGGATAARYVDFFSGTTELRVASLLNSPANVANTIYIQVFKMPGKDYRVFMNTLTGISVNWWSPYLARFRAHGGEDEDQPWIPQSEKEYESERTRMQAFDRCFADYVDSVQLKLLHHMRRFGELKDAPEPTTDFNTFINRFEEMTVHAHPERIPPHSGEENLGTHNGQEIYEPNDPFFFACLDNTLSEKIQAAFAVALESPSRFLQSFQRIVQTFQCSDRTTMDKLDCITALTHLMAQMNREHIPAHAGSDTPGLGQPIDVQDNKVGVILSEQEAPTTVGRVENRAVVTNTRASKYNNDRAWTIADMLTRANLVETLTWTGTDPTNAPIKTYDVVLDLLKLAIAIDPFNRFLRFRCKTIKIRFNIIANRFAFGDIWAVWMPTMIPQTHLALPTTFDPGMLSTLPHVSLDPNGGTVAELEIPFTFNKQWVDLQNGDILGQLHLVPIVAFTPGTDGPPDAQIQLFVSFEDAEFKQPRPGTSVFRMDRPGLGPANPRFIAHAGEQEVPDRNKPMHEYNFRQLAAVENIEWGDHANTQFGEDFFSLRELCKKYHKFYRDTQIIDTSTLTGAQQIGLDPIILTIEASAFTRFGSVRAFENYIGFCAQMYRLFRGALVYKMRVRAYATSKVATSIVYPIPTLGVRAYLVGQESGSASITTGATLGFPGAGTPNQTAMTPVSYAYASDNQTAEFKIPFLMNRSAGLITQWFDKLAGIPEYLIDNFYSMFAGIAYYIEGIPTDATVRGAFNYQFMFELDVAFSDEAAFGVYVGHPAAFILGDYTEPTAATSPDQWASSTRAVKNSAPSDATWTILKPWAR